MTNDSTVGVAEAQARLPSLVKQDSFAISQNGKVVGFYLSKARVEALVESMELLSSPGFNSALKEMESGRMKCYDVAELDAAMSK